MDIPVIADSLVLVAIPDSQVRRGILGTVDSPVLLVIQEVE